MASKGQLFLTTQKTSILMDQAQALIREGELEEALSYYETIISRDPQDTDAWVKLAELLIRLGKFTNAKQILFRAAETYAAQGSLMSAIHVNKLIREIEPFNQEVQNSIFRLYAATIGQKHRIDEQDPDLQFEPTVPVERKSSATVNLFHGLDNTTAELIVRAEEEAKAARMRPEFDAAEIDLLYEAEGAGHLPIAEIVTDETALEDLEVNKESEELISRVFESIHKMDAADSTSDSEPRPIEITDIPLFSDLSPIEFMQTIEQLKIRQAQSGEVIIQEGEVGDAFFIIANGQVNVSKTNADLTETVLTQLYSGDFFGEIAMLTQSRRTASVSAITDVDLLEMDRAGLVELFAIAPGIRHTVEQYSQKRLAQMLVSVSDFFKGTEESDRAELLEKFEVRQVRSGNIVLSQNEQSEGLYLVLLGELAVSAKQDGRYYRLEDLTMGAMLGESSVLSQKPSPYTYIAKHDTHLYFIRNEFLLPLSKKFPGIFDAIKRSMDIRTSNAIAAGMQAP